ncbi:BhlA/UviB family holin-like peptide [uncultured Clostridium sp.]|jgi:preprotein translocase subunit YajC|uniref:BhlA/UviB family holin-like peptide n=1 Tax=uncultured Clostridium sp. TaxID=59620 RepID=UPI00261E5951|nr:BhlA/UviB family holin-like peptide [uncultured Clostridium sp.]
MENEIVKTIASQGAWALLFVWLLFYVLRENSKRENNYQETINKLADKISIIEDIKEDVKEIKTKVNKEQK